MEWGAEGTPPAPDEGWWAAVLSEPESEQHAADPVGVAEDWNWAGSLFDTDQRIELEVVGHNRGGLLVTARSLRGFVPVSHLCGFDPQLHDQEGAKLELLASKVGRKLSVKVIEVDPGRGRLVFSERAALAKSGERNRLLECLSPGDLVSGVVTNITPFGAFVDLGGLEGLVHISELSWSRVRHPEDLVACGQKIQTEVISVDPEQCRVALSLRALQPDPWQEAGQRFQVGDVVRGTVTSLVSFGAFVALGDGLEGLIHRSEFGSDDAEQTTLRPGAQVAVQVLNLDPQARRIGLSLRSVTESEDFAQEIDRSRPA